MGFSGLLFLVGERLSPGSTILVKYQGLPVKVLPAVFHSSETLGMAVFLTVASDYEFTALAPDGSTSTPVALRVPAAAPANFTLSAPIVRMVYPPALETTFAGTAWILGERFMPGASLLVSYGGAPEVAFPLVYVNERSLGWVTAAPPAGNVRLRVVNPTLNASQAVTIAVTGTATPAASGLPAPGLSLPPTSVAAPFVGAVSVFGNHFQPGAVVELSGGASGTVTTPVLFVSSGEAWWTLAYPQPGTYRARLRNPDGQATGDWPFTVR